MGSPSAVLLRERLGNAVGWLSAPLFALSSALRRARTFHPEGMVFVAVVEPIGGDSVRSVIGDRLCGPALLRFSTALWKRGRERRDALGCAIRFRRNVEPSSEPSPGDQDLLLATIRSPWTMFAPFATRVHDFLANRYFGVAPFDVPGVGRAKWRLTPEACGSSEGRSRADRLLKAVARGEAILQLEVRRTWTRHYLPVARVVLRGVADVDQEALRFDPFRSGCGIEPRGFVHALRRGTYRASQRARP